MSVDVGGNCAMGYAAAAGFYEAVGVLLQAGSDPNHQNCKYRAHTAFSTCSFSLLALPLLALPLHFVTVLALPCSFSPRTLSPFDSSFQTRQLVSVPSVEHQTQHCIVGLAANHSTVSALQMPAAS